MTHQLSLFANETALPIPGWRGMTPPEMADAAPDGYHLDLDGDEPVYEADERATNDAEADSRFSPREWAPYCADTIALPGDDPEAGEPARGTLGLHRIDRSRGRKWRANGARLPGRTARKLRQPAS